MSDHLGITTPPPSNYADSHDIIRISAKRFAASPWQAHYASEETVYGVYGGRLYPLSLGADPVADYWHLRTQAGLFDVPERPIEIIGPDAEAFLNRLLTRDMSTVPPGRARYALACDDSGGILMDGVLIRWANDRFWYVLADGDFLGWVHGVARDFEVTIHDPGVWVLQIQGPRSLDVLGAACDGTPPEPFPYFSAATTVLGGQEVLVTRTGWTGELGFEIYASAATDHDALWRHLLETGAPHGLRVLSLECMGIRRLEAGILDNGTDMDSTMTPYAVGLGRYVDESKPEFVGKAALSQAPRAVQLTGLTGCRAPKPGEELHLDSRLAGHVRAGAWSPSLGCGIGYAFLDRLASDALTRGDAEVLTAAADGSQFTPTHLPFLDPEKRLARGLNLD